MVGRLERWSGRAPLPPLTPKANTVRSRQRRRGPCSEATNREPPPSGSLFRRRCLAAIGRSPVPSSRHFEGIING
jgi:hypothetical protein